MLRPTQSIFKSVGGARLTVCGCGGGGAMLAEMARLSAQHRPLYCYLLMSLWIFLLVAGMYKYVVTVDNLNIPKQPLMRRDTYHNNFRGDSKLKKIVQKFCNAPENIHLESEGAIKENAWALQGVIVIIRHGDRGPLTHVRDIESVNCDVSNPTSLLQRYQEYINNATGAGRAPWAQSPGPFHNFPLLPSSPTTACRLGQLTLVGVQQLLSLGALLGEAYSSKFGWNIQQNNISNTGYKLNKTADVKKNLKSPSQKIKLIGEIPIDKLDKKPIEKDKVTSKNDPKSNQKVDPNIDAKMQTGKPSEGEIIVHSTRYRRALQSALALVWGMLGGSAGVGGAIAHESPSLAFCSADCACPGADKYAKIVSRELKDRLEAHPAIGDLVSQLFRVVSQSPSQISGDPHILQDALLAYLCHSAPLPCVEKPIEPAKQIKINDNIKQIPADRQKLPDDRVNGAFRPPKQKSRRLLFNFENPFVNRHLPNARDTKIRSYDVHPKSVALDFDSQMEKEKLGYYQQKLLENADSNYQDVILVKRNMDGDFNFNGDAPNAPDAQDLDDSEDYEEKEEEKRKNGKSPNTETICIRKDQVTGLFAYTDWELKQSAKSKNLRKVSLLRAYGMIRHIVQYILRMISDGKPKFVLYSGHDKTLQYLSLALGLTSDSLLHIQYASRITIEIYKNVDGEHSKTGSRSGGRSGRAGAVAPLDFYFRFVMNGQDVTNQLSFCKDKIYVVPKNNLKNGENFVKGKDVKSYLCRIENIIRFTHEDYFAIFNATNFKDACAVR